MINGPRARSGALRCKPRAALEERRPPGRYPVAPRPLQLRHLQPEFMLSQHFRWDYGRIPQMLSKKEEVTVAFF